ncbi:hypothetical protein Q8A73_007079 [Channa argus]|nr:hypothetical protein Q8A73_007079 [Channa argus]
MTTVHAAHAWCLSACVCARLHCQSSGPGSPGISPPPMAHKIFLAPRIHPPAAEAWRRLFRLLFLALTEAVEAALPCTLYPRSYTPSLRSPWEQESSLSAMEFLLLTAEPTC